MRNDKKIPKSTKKRLLSRDGKTCQKCGGTKKLTIHHIIPRKNNGGNNNWNLITLCQPCHNEWHSLSDREGSHTFHQWLSMPNLQELMEGAANPVIYAVTCFDRKEDKEYVVEFFNNREDAENYITHCFGDYIRIINVNSYNNRSYGHQCYIDMQSGDLIADRKVIAKRYKTDSNTRLYFHLNKKMMVVGYGDNRDEALSAAFSYYHKHKSET